MTSIVNKVETGIPPTTNNRIIDLLYLSTSWGFGSDVGLSQRSTNKMDSGFVVTSFSDSNPSFQIDSLNIYANVILDAISHNSFFKYNRVRRLYWNWYHSNSQAEFHQDNEADNQVSIIYNLHDNDGGTEFQIGDKIEFFKSEPSQALIFPSKIFHRGIAPKEKCNRFCLNILTEI